MKKKHVVSIREQNARIKLFYPKFNSHILDGCATWEGYIQPTPLSDVYKVRFQYKITDKPRAFVISPELRYAKGAVRIEHTYSKQEICLYLPKSGEWENDKYIAQTIIPWTYLWLYYYEIWLVTGEWEGGGMHPEISNTNSLNRPRHPKAIKKRLRLH